MLKISKALKGLIVLRIAECDLSMVCNPNGEVKSEI